MNKQRNRSGTNEILKRTTLILTTTALAGQMLITGCASVNRKEESISIILVKENELIEKLKAERAQPEIVEAVSRNESLKKAEAHLSMSLEELLHANKTILKKIIKTNKEEVELGKNQRNDN